MRDILAGRLAVEERAEAVEVAVPACGVLRAQLGVGEDVGEDEHAPQVHVGQAALEPQRGRPSMVSCVPALGNAGLAQVEPR